MLFGWPGSASFWQRPLPPFCEFINLCDMASCHVWVSYHLYLFYAAHLYAFPLCHLCFLFDIYFNIHSFSSMWDLVSCRGPKSRGLSIGPSPYFHSLSSVKLFQPLRNINGQIIYGIQYYNQSPEFVSLHSRFFINLNERKKKVVENRKKKLWEGVGIYYLI